MRLIDGMDWPLAVSAAEFRSAVHVEPDEDDDLISSLLQDAQEVVETASRRPLTVRGVEFGFVPPSGAQGWYFPCAPVVSVTSAAVVARDGSVTALAANDYVLHGRFDAPHLVFNEEMLAILSSGNVYSVTVVADVGYGAGDCLRALRQAVILLAKEWYDDGLTVGEIGELKKSFAMPQLVRQNRYQRVSEFV